RFVGNVDPEDLASNLVGLDPAETLFIVSSKTFTTVETLINARSASKWIHQHLGAGAVARHVVAVTADEDAVKRSGIGAEIVFPLWDWVGGRFSVGSELGRRADRQTLRCYIAGASVALALVGGIALTFSARSQRSTAQSSDGRTSAAAKPRERSVADSADSTATKPSVTRSSDRAARPSQNADERANPGEAVRPGQSADSPRPPDTSVVASPVTTVVDGVRWYPSPSSPVAIVGDPQRVKLQSGSQVLAVRWTGQQPRELVFVDVCVRSSADPNFNVALDCATWSSMSLPGTASGVGATFLTVFRGPEPSGDLRWGCFAPGDQVPPGILGSSTCFVRVTNHEQGNRSDVRELAFTLG
ncbi:MAG: hypothetical protein ACKOYM_02360, partial [Actinomycetes bacterium]